jgi:hyperosmotically inducible periplasmic protein
MNRKFFQWELLLCVFLSLSITLISCGVKDSDIQEKISQAINADPDLTNVKSIVKDGVVTLSGEVKDDVAKAASESLIKPIKGVKSVVDNITITPPPPPPVMATPVTSADDELMKGVTDATKDFPSVKAAVNNGVITLTGEIKRSNLAKLLQSLSSLRAKKIDNLLTYK